MDSITSIIKNNPTWAARNFDVIARQGLNSVSNFFNPNVQNDNYSQGNCGGNGSASQGEIYIRDFSDNAHSQTDRDMQKARAAAKNGWK